MVGEREVVVVQPMGRGRVDQRGLGRRPRDRGQRRVAAVARLVRPTPRRVIRVALRGLRGNARRLVGTFIAIVLGVSFMSGVRILGDTTRASFDSLFATIGNGIDVVVRVTPRDDGPGGREGGDDSGSADDDESGED